MSKSLANKLLRLTEENKKLKKLVQATEVEIKNVIKRNQEESNKIKKLIETITPALESDSVHKAPQTQSSTIYLTHIYETENDFFVIKDMLLELSVQNVAIMKKVERRIKKNKLLDDANADYKERIKHLVLDKVNLQEKILQQRLLKDTLNLFNVYRANEREPVQNSFMKI